MVLITQTTLRSITVLRPFKENVGLQPTNMQPPPAESWSRECGVVQQQNLDYLREMTVQFRPRVFVFERSPLLSMSLSISQLFI